MPVLNEELDRHKEFPRDSIKRRLSLCVIKERDVKKLVIMRSVGFVCGAGCT